MHCLSLRSSRLRGEKSSYKNNLKLVTLIGLITHGFLRIKKAMLQLSWTAVKKFKKKEHRIPPGYKPWASY
ncbi:MAG: hypothetical protein C4520_15970 [Candidatus Abyssobacteria bacterium SURF_5]|uniref:Uncharacterized protein n=1 Tax=Abyssobacteria bacterium (strain SURF_5) TaxID=2093360 RepID=A0A3A4N7E2_ABYX5|nr:MAG: hypothetical protein C4520_15970 [Candidatus Abyssubacteria bacterium SURF_5]